MIAYGLFFCNPQYVKVFFLHSWPLLFIPQHPWGSIRPQQQSSSELFCSAGPTTIQLPSIVKCFTNRHQQNTKLHGHGLSELNLHHHNSSFAFNIALKTGNELTDLIMRGRPFHSFGPNCEKAPLCLYFVLETHRRCWFSIEGVTVIHSSENDTRNSFLQISGG